MSFKLTPRQPSLWVFAVLAAALSLATIAAVPIDPNEAADLVEGASRQAEPLPVPEPEQETPAPVEIQNQQAAPWAAAPTENDEVLSYLNQARASQRLTGLTIST